MIFSDALEDEIHCLKSFFWPVLMLLFTTMAVNITNVDYILTLHKGMNSSFEEGITNNEPGRDNAKLHNISFNNGKITSSIYSSISTAAPSGVHWSAEMDTTTLLPVPDDTTLPHDHNMAPLGLLTILILAVIGNITVCLVVRIDRHLHHMTYYFFISLAVVHLLMVAVVMPPAILIILAGKSTISEFPHAVQTMRKESSACQNDSLDASRCKTLFLLFRFLWKGTHLHLKTNS